MVWIPATALTPDGKAPVSPPSDSANPAGANASSGTSGSAGTLTPSQPILHGPPGTVAMYRTVAEMCECDDGYLKQANGSCAAIADTCSPEGATASAIAATVCCPGLDAVPVFRHEGSKCVLDASQRYQHCVKCGNQICGPGEDSCNCPVDCRTAP